MVTWLLEGERDIVFLRLATLTLAVGGAVIALFGVAGLLGVL